MVFTLGGKSGATNNKQFRSLGGLLGCPEVAEDERFEPTDQRVENRDALKVILDGCFVKKTSSEWLNALEGNSRKWDVIQADQFH
jgi:succinate--hydroxymethylglutarate CoA-transferase